MGGVVGAVELQDPDHIATGSCRSGEPALEGAIGW